MVLLVAAMAIAFAMDELQGAAVYLSLLQRVLHTIPPIVADWGVIASSFLIPIAVVELIKAIQRVAARKGLPQSLFAFYKERIKHADEQ